MGADGASPRELARPAGRRALPSFSRTARQIAFTTHAVAADDTEIAVAGADGGSAPTPLSANTVFDLGGAGP